MCGIASECVRLRLRGDVLGVCCVCVCLGWTRVQCVVAAWWASWRSAAQRLVPAAAPSPVPQRAVDDDSFHA